MSETAELAAATLEHTQRIRILTDRIDRQRRSLSSLGFAVGVLVALQAFQAWLPEVARAIGPLLLAFVAVNFVVATFFRASREPS